MLLNTQRNNIVSHYKLSDQLNIILLVYKKISNLNECYSHYGWSENERLYMIRYILHECNMHSIEYTKKF